MVPIPPSKLKVSSNNFKILSKNPFKNEVYSMGMLSIFLLITDFPPNSKFEK